MLFAFTDAQSGNEQSIEAGMVMRVCRAPAENGGLVLETHIITSVMTPQGPMAFAARESVEEISRRSNYARTIVAGQPYDSAALGFRQQ